MPTTALATWSLLPGPTLALLVTAAVYLRGWRRIRLTRPAQFPLWRALCFLAGLVTLWLAIASPLDSLSNLLLVVHMTQHLLLMSVAPPLVALGAPLVPLLRGLPRAWVREGLGPFFTLAPVQALERLAKSRLLAWLLMNASFLAWHLPAAYDLALAHPGLHMVEHATFFFTSLLFWWPIVEPWPTVYPGSRWLLLPYLMSADIINTALSAFLSFAGRVVYPTYAAAPRLFGISALSDQVAAGSLMWVLGSTAFLGPITGITVRQLSNRSQRRAAAQGAQAAAARSAAREAIAAIAMPAIRSSPIAAPPTARTDTGRQRQAPRLDLFAFRPLGRFFRSRYGRQSLQAVMLVLAAAVIVDGLFGHPMASMNLAGIVPWTYARAFFVLALLLVGNLFCMSCPFTLPRELAKKLAAAAGLTRLPWPRMLRNKWFAAALLGLFFWAYEAFDLWNSPARTAALLLAYFVTAILVDSIFRGAAFCKYVCPVGQFNLVSSLLSPTELQARSLSTCSSCETRNCIAGTHDAATGRLTQRGCELDLFMPAKSSNLDCTLCMDCVKACPHDNIGLYLQAPARDLVQLTLADPQRSSVGHLGWRPDVAALALLLVAAGFASAAVMVSPVAGALARVSAALPAMLAPAAGLALAAAAPVLLFGLLAAAVFALPGSPAALPEALDSGFRARFCRWSLALLPLGLGMWAAHLSFHLLTGWNSLLPALLQAARDLHLAAAPAPNWAAEHALLTPGSLLGLQLLLLDAGLLYALYLGWRLVTPVDAAGAVASEGWTAARPVQEFARYHPTAGRRRYLPLAQVLRSLAPWAALALLLYGAGVWVLLEPMQMRGMMGM